MGNQTELRPGGHVWKTSCDNPDCGGSCFVCCCGYCIRCGLFEGCTTTDCPGVESYAQHADDVYEGKEDFINGQWVQGAVSPHSPVAYAERSK